MASSQGQPTTPAVEEKTGKEEQILGNSRKAEKGENDKVPN